ncbi:zinc finger, FYVE domain containing protein [Ophiocordyceps camponoti-floridani]|uniref:Zinc finger, FYVE domain containing protein n=1 Tax=Ophiocordyceps camponoti-floridani TaxID=2030778 RepID=A0A8H4QAK4_9HYPO|nr:zinc finger, FYVE domain containing protein [Ophiocordyceps camponoti-floridani]
MTDDDTDKALRDRLETLRGNSGRKAVPEFSREAVSREDALAERLRQLRHGQEADNNHDAVPVIRPREETDDADEEEADAVLRTDDDTLEHLLGSETDQDDEEERVQTLLRDLSIQDDKLSLIKDQDAETTPRVDAKPPQSDPHLPSLPSTLPSPPLHSAPQPSQDLANRLAALRLPSETPTPPSLPSVPSTQPSSSAAPAPRRLTSRYGYTDDDVDSWCTVCLEDATLRCLGCDDDPYCHGCWLEMHRGPAAPFDHASHKAVQFTRHGGDKVALGAS